MRSGRPQLDVACNDPANGVFAHRAPMLGMGCAEFEARDLFNGPRFVELWGDKSFIRLAGKKWPVSGSKEWVGNWCWNRYAIGDATRTSGWWMVDFLKWLRGRRLFSCNTAESEFFDWFNSDAEIPDSHLHELIYRCWRDE